MYSLVINETEYKLPNKLTISQWMQIASLNDNFDDYKVNMVKTVIGCSNEEAAMIPMETVDLVVSFILVMFHDSKFKEHDELKLIDFDNITFGQWVDLDVYLSNGITKHLSDIVDVLYDIKDGGDKYFIEVMGDVTKYINYRKHIYLQYKELFNSPSDDDSPKMPQNPAKTWHSILMTVCDDDITKINQVLDMPLIMVFNFLAHRKEKAYKAYLESQRQRA